MKRAGCCLAGLLTIGMLTSCTKSLFRKVDPSDTGITFSNRVSGNEKRNVINYSNIYNGGGVAIADFNNDGLKDIYFAGNMVDNKLYLNQGGFKFKDVTNEAKVAGEGRWSAGVSAVDINSDGLMDLYVCATTLDKPEQRANLLYVNQGNDKNNVPVFKEMAAAYNLADTSYSTMAAFFDYDHDGDLDLYLLVNKFNSRSSMDRYSVRLSKGESESTDRLYRNDGVIDSLGHPYFTDVSKQAGIQWEGFGLGVNIADFNGDGWDDIYVSNDFISNDLLYENNGDGTFTNKASKYFKHTAYASMGDNVADINNDGHPDVVMMDMLPEDNYRKKMVLQPDNYMNMVNNRRYHYDYQLVRNQLQVYQGINPENGNPLYADVGIYSGIAATDWSWAPLIADFDNDGWRDIIITNGFPKDVTDHDFEDYVTKYHRYLSLDKLASMAPSLDISNYAFKNNGDLTFTDVTSKWGLKMPSFSYGAAPVDLDNDGDLDLVINNINDSAFVFRNYEEELNPDKKNYLEIRFKGNKGNDNGLGAKVTIEYGDHQHQYYEHSVYRGYLSSVDPVAHFGLGANRMVKKLTVTWPDGRVQEMNNIKANQIITVDIDNAVFPNTITNKKLVPSSDTLAMFKDVTSARGIDYVHQEWDFNDFNVQPLLPHKLSQYGPALTVGDVNGDGLDDIYISGAHEYKGHFLIQQKDGSFRDQDLIRGEDPGHRQEEEGALFFDADGDGDNDLYITSGGYELNPGDAAYQDRLLINNDGQFVPDNDALPRFLSSSFTVTAADYDHDGDLDLFVTGRVKPHQYPKPANSYILENVSANGRVRFRIANAKVAPFLNSIGMVTDALWTDFNNDGWMDLVLVGEWMSPKFLENDHGSFKDVTDASGLAGYKGWWNSLCAGDFDNDGDTDYIVGNLGTNTFFQASDKYPVRVYGNDYDGNGTFDMIPTIYFKNRHGDKIEAPFHGRRDLAKQLPDIRSKFKSYHDFAVADMDEILSKYNRKGELVYKANYMKSSYLENNGDGTFDIHALPDKVQWSPMYGCTAEDVNNDGNLDVVFVGNDYGTEVSTGHYDALNGLVLTGNGDGTFNVVNFPQSGFFVPGDGKALVKLRGVDGSLLTAASQNRGALKLFKATAGKRLIALKPGDAYAMFHFKNGKIRKEECYYGSSFLSASGRFIAVDNDVRSVEIVNFRGDSRTITLTRQQDISTR